MTSKVAKVLRGFVELTDAERSELIEEINKYQRGDRTLRETIKRNAGDAVKGSTVNFGPVPGGCPCCGR
jgi:hypothetical protein